MSATAPFDLAALVAALKGDDAARTAASDALATAAEDGADLGAAAGALAVAAGDPVSAVRGNAIAALACLGEKGGQIDAAGPALARACGDSEHYIRSNAAWALQFVLGHVDVPGAAAALVALLADEKGSGNVRASLEAALASTASRASAVAALEAGLLQPGEGVRRRSALVLSLDDAQRRQWPALAARFAAADAEARLGVLQALAEAIPQRHWDPSLVGLLAQALEGAEPLRFAACSTLILASEREQDISAALPALAAAMADASERVRKEALWAVYTVAWQGRPVEPALAALERAAAAPPTRGNATVALTLRDLHQGRVGEAEARLDAPDPTVNFGAAYAITDFAARKQDRALLERLLHKLPFGLTNPSLGDGVAGSLLAAIQRKDARSKFVQTTLQGLVDANPDPLRQAVLLGVVQRVNERLRR
jgi:HEAT repeat protein